MVDVNTLLKLLSTLYSASGFLVFISQTICLSKFMNFTFFFPNRIYNNGREASSGCCEVSAHKWE